jgi:8-oxo-dGTP pyrophosphatase MutT (NUDIX family)
MTDSERTNRFLSTAEFFALAKARLSLNTPERPLSSSGSLRARSRRCCSRSALRILQSTQERLPSQAARSTQLMRAPAAAALREAEEEVSLDRRFVEPIGYLDVHVTPSGYRILPVLARVREGFSVRFGRDEVKDTFEVPLVFLMTPQNHRREKVDWNGLITSVYAISFNDRKIWGVTAGILRNLWDRIYKV